MAKLLQEGKIVREFPLGANVRGLKGDALVLERHDLERLAKNGFATSISLWLKTEIASRITGDTETEFVSRDEIIEQIATTIEQTGGIGCEEYATLIREGKSNGND